MVDWLAITVWELDKQYTRAKDRTAPLGAQALVTITWQKNWHEITQGHAHERARTNHRKTITATGKNQRLLLS